MDIEKAMGEYKGSFHLTQELLCRVKSCLDIFNYAEAESWLILADNAFDNAAVLSVRLAPHWRKEDKKTARKNMEELLGHLEGAWAVLEDAKKKNKK